MAGKNTCSRLDIRHALFRLAAVMIFAGGLVDDADAQKKEINMEVTVRPAEITVLYFNATDDLLWVEKLEDVKSRLIVPIEDKALMGKIPFTDLQKAKPANHFDCTTCPEKKADLVISGVASKAVYCEAKEQAPGKYMAAPLVVEDLSNLSEGRLIKLAVTKDQDPCPFPKKCHCAGGTCCCW